MIFNKSYANGNSNQNKGLLNASIERNIPFRAISDNIQQVAQCYIKRKVAQGMDHDSWMPLELLKLLKQQT